MFYCGAACVDVLVLLVFHYQRPTEAPRRPIERSLERSGVLLPDGPLGGLVWWRELASVFGTDGPMDRALLGGCACWWGGGVVADVLPIHQNPPCCSVLGRR